jgi:hypothetical protein
LLNIASLPAFRIVEARAEPFDAMVGLVHTGQMPTDATQRCVYDMAWRAGEQSTGIAHVIPAAGMEKTTHSHKTPKS